MNWRLIFQLSLFGLAMAIFTVYWLPSNLEPFFWLAIFVISAYLIAKNCREKYFLYGLFVSLANSIWIILIHVLLFKAYTVNHPKEMTMMQSLPLPTHPRLMMILTGPVFGLIFGLVLGLFAFIASKIWESQPSN